MTANLALAVVHSLDAAGELSISKDSIGCCRHSSWQCIVHVVGRWGARRVHVAAYRRPKLLIAPCRPVRKYPARYLVERLRLSQWPRLAPAFPAGIHVAVKLVPGGFQGIEENFVAPAVCECLIEVLIGGTPGADLQLWRWTVRLVGLDDAPAAREEIGDCEQFLGSRRTTHGYCRCRSHRT